MIKGKNQSFKLLRHTKFVSFHKIIGRGREDNASNVSILVNKKGKIKVTTINKDITYLHGVEYNN